MVRRGRRYLGKAISLSSTLISHQRSYRDPQAGETLLADGIAAAPSCLPTGCGAGACTERAGSQLSPPISGTPQPQPWLCPQEKPLCPKSPEEQMSQQSCFSRAICLPPSPPSPSLPSPQTPSLAHLHIPAGGSPSHLAAIHPGRYPWQTRKRKNLPFLPPAIPSRGRGDVPALVTCLSPARPRHPPPCCQGIIARQKDALSIDLQSNLIGLQRPLDCFHPGQGLKKYINKSINPMPRRGEGRMGPDPPGRGEPLHPRGPQSSFLVGTAALNGGGSRYGTPPYLSTPRLGSSRVCGCGEKDGEGASPSWDGMLRLKAVWEDPRGWRASFSWCGRHPNEAPLAQRGKLRQVHPCCRTGALGIPQVPPRRSTVSSMSLLRCAKSHRQRRRVTWPPEGRPRWGAAHCSQINPRCWVNHPSQFSWPGTSSCLPWPIFWRRRGASTAHRMLETAASSFFPSPLPPLSLIAA